MGYSEGKGLGRNEQGRVDIVESSKQRGRRGLGLQLEGLEADEDAKWLLDEEEVRILLLLCHSMEVQKCLIQYSTRNFLAQISRENIFFMCYVKLLRMSKVHFPTIEYLYTTCKIA